MVASLENGLSACEAHDLVANDADAAVVGCVQLEHHCIELGGRVELFRARQNGRRLTSTWRSVEQQMRQLVMLYELLYLNLSNKELIL